jgi:hypothetical protein
MQIRNKGGAAVVITVESDPDRNLAVGKYECEGCQGTMTTNGHPGRFGTHDDAVSDARGRAGVQAKLHAKVCEFEP